MGGAEMKIVKWHYDGSEPEACAACPEENNGLFVAEIREGDVRFFVPFCIDCAKKLGYKRAQK